MDGVSLMIITMTNFFCLFLFMKNIGIIAYACRAVLFPFKYCNRTARIAFNKDDRAFAHAHIYYITLIKYHQIMTRPKAKSIIN
jgi:hypothetical protein